MARWVNGPSSWRDMPPERQTIFAEMLKPNFSEWDAETSDEILTHPRFVPARIAFVDAVLDLCEDIGFSPGCFLKPDG